MGPEGIILVNPPITTFQQSLTHSAMIYMREVVFEDLASILDFLYFGEANVCQDNLDSFLSVAEQLKISGLMGNHGAQVPKKSKRFASTPKKSQTQETYMISLKTSKT